MIFNAKILKFCIRASKYRSFKTVAEFKYSGMTIINQNYVHEEVKSGFNMGNACYHAVQYLILLHLSH